MPIVVQIYYASINLSINVSVSHPA